MGKPLSKDAANKILIENGYFDGFGKLLREYDLTDEKAARIKAGLYKHILIKVLEAKRETGRLQTTIAQMESACRAGAIPNRQTVRNSFDNNHNNLMSALRPFDGWAVSLLETNIALLATVHNPETAGIRVNSLRSSFAELWNLRMPGHKPYDNYPDVFDLSIFVAT